MMMKLRAVLADDAEAMSAVLRDIAASRNSLGFKDPDQVREHYIAHPDRIRCTVALADDGELAGFQSLRRATEGNAFGVTVGWGIIGTHIGPRFARQGVGRQLFAATREAALAAGITRIDASIGADNALGLAYYEAMGFRTYRTPPHLVCKVLDLSATEASGVAHKPT